MKTLLGYTTSEKSNRKWAIAFPSPSKENEWAVAYVSDSPEESKKLLQEKTGMQFESVISAGFKLVRVEISMRVTGVLEEIE